jgi:ABC-2 type transport system ATP-binding protein
MIYAIEMDELGKRYGRCWALQECTVRLSAGRVAALVGPNGAGKTTLLHLAAGLLRPTQGSVQVFGYTPRRHRIEALSRVGFVAQDHPLYRYFTVAETMELGRHLNPRWDEHIAVGRLRELKIPLEQPVGKLSGGQQAQVALAVALAKRPDLLMLDEPLASLDPLARQDFLSSLMNGVTAEGLTVLISSHIVADLERVCDYLILLSASRVQLAGDIEEIVQHHKLLVGPAREVSSVAHLHHIVQERRAERQTMLLVRTNGPVFDPSWEVRDVTLEQVILAYLDQGRNDLHTNTAYLGSRNEESVEEGIE